MSCAVLFFFVDTFPNPKQKIHVPGYMLKFIPQSAKLSISFYNLKALCEKTSWLTHVANDHDVIDLLSCNTMFDHFQTRSFYSTVVARAWFFASNKIKLPKMLRFLLCKHVALLPCKQCRSSNFSHSLTFFYRLGIERKKIVLNIEQWKNEGKVVWNLSEFVKTFMLTQNEGEWPTCLALTSFT